MLVLETLAVIKYLTLRAFSLVLNDLSLILNNWYLVTQPHQILISYLVVYLVR